MQRWPTKTVSQGKKGPLFKPPSRQTSVLMDESVSASEPVVDEASILAKLITYAKISGNNNKGKGKENEKSATAYVPPHLRGTISNFLFYKYFLIYIFYFLMIFSAKTLYYYCHFLISMNIFPFF
jgi:hypothetical protein